MTSASSTLRHPEAAADRAAARRDRVTAGLEELEQWLLDQISGGLSGLERGGYAPFDRVAARLVDAQAPGVASLVRALPGELAHQDWPGRVLEQLGALYLLVQAHRRLDDLPPDLAATVRSRVGYPVSRTEVLAGPGVVDHWYAAGSLDNVEYRLDTRRVWLWGSGSRRWALLLSFAPPGGSLDRTVTAGRPLHACLHFYPGSGQFRAVVGERWDVLERVPPPAPEPASSVAQRFADLLAADPWATRMPAVLSGQAVPPTGPGQAWSWQDASRDTCPLVELPGAPWPLLARSTSGPVPVFGEWTARGLRPVSLLPDGQGAPFCATVATEEG